MCILNVFFLHIRIAEVVDIVNLVIFVLFICCRFVETFPLLGRFSNLLLVHFFLSVFSREFSMWFYCTLSVFLGRLIQISILIHFDVQHTYIVIHCNIYGAKPKKKMETTSNLFEAFHIFKST